MDGLLVAIEGPKFVGKTTLVNELKRRPETRQWVFTKQPTGGFDLNDEQRYAGVELARRIADDRAVHLAEVIIPALRSGRVVVTDRYVLSSFAFHCRDEAEPDVVADLNREFRRPDILVVLLCSPATPRPAESRMRSSHAAVRSHLAGTGSPRLSHLRRPVPAHFRKSGRWLPFIRSARPWPRQLVRPPSWFATGTGAIPVACGATPQARMTSSRA